MYRGEPNSFSTNAQATDTNAALGGSTEGFGQMLRTSLEFLHRRVLIVGLCVVIGMAMGVAYLKVTPPVYKASARILIENPRVLFVEKQSFISDGSVDQAQMENQIELLKSKPVAQAVIKKLKLSTSPEFNGSKLSPIAWLKRLMRLPFGGPTNDGKTAAPDSEDLIAAFEAGLTCERVGMSNVVEVSYRASDPERAALIANSVVEAYLAEQLEAKSQANQLAVGWLKNRLSELGGQALSAEQDVNQYRANHNVVIVSGRSVQDQQVSELNTRLVDARAKTTEARARLKRYEKILDSDLTGQKSTDGNANMIVADAAIADAMTSPIITGLRQTYLSLARRNAEWTARYGSNHLAVIGLRKRMNDVRTSIVEELRRLAEAARNEFAVALQSEQAIEAQLSAAMSQSQAANSKESKLRELELNARNYRNLYESFLQQQTRTIQQQSFPMAEARTIWSASPPQSKSKPKSSLIMAFATFAGGMLGLGIGFLLDLTDRVYRTSAQVESSIDVRCLSLMPIVEETRARAARPKNDLAARQRIFVQGAEPFWAVTANPHSQFAESVRFIKVAVEHALDDGPCKVIGITSAVAGEGKSTIAAALALVCAQSGKRVILLDGDFRHPSLSKSLAPSAKLGLAEVVARHSKLDDVIWRNHETKLAFLPAGDDRSVGFASDLLSSDGAHTLIEWLRDNFDYVIIDLPPLAPIVDVQATTHWIDGFILAIEWGRTQTDLVRQALHTAPNVGERLIGAVLNKTDMHALSRYDSCHSSAYYYEHRRDAA